MARIFKTPFGAQGDTEQVPEAPQGDGSVSLTQGFGYDYEREYEDPAAKDIRREVMNGLFHDVTEAIGDIQLSGVAKWSADAAPYPAGAVVWHNSVAWQSRVNNNSTTPSEGAIWTAVATADSVGNAYVPLTRTIAADTGLSGGGSLAANRTLSVNYGTTAGTAAQGNDSRIVNSVQTSGNQTIAGVKTFSSFPVTPSAAPTADYQAANKKYVDDVTNSQPSTNGLITLNGTTDNTVVMSGIVTEPELEIGDVIRIDTGAYSKLHTVESITNNGSIIVNYEHAGNRGDGSLKLPDFTGQATVTRIAKWFNCSQLMGKAPVNVTHIRTNGVTYTSPYFPITVFISTVGVDPVEAPLLEEIINGVSYIFGRASKAGASSVVGVISSGSGYRKVSGATDSMSWIEIR